MVHSYIRSNMLGEVILSDKASKAHQLQKGQVIYVLKSAIFWYTISTVIAVDQILYLARRVPCGPPPTRSKNSVISPLNFTFIFLSVR